MTVAAALWGCDSQHVGDPCIPEEEYRPEFAGFSKDEVNVESRSFQCETRLCLVNKFQGRVSCPYGQSALGECLLPDDAGEVAVPVPPQLIERPPAAAVYCSCRCSGPSTHEPYCDCPSGYSCADLIPPLDLGDDQLPGGYCVKNGTDVDSARIADEACDRGAATCGP
jgi:hypothetical protein